METVAIDDVEPTTLDEHRTHEFRRLTDALGASDLAINHYVLEPGERFSGSVHAHLDQEELFVVLDGEATFRTGDWSDDGADGEEVTVGENEAIRFAPGEYQTGWNDGDEEVVALALGAPRESTDVRLSHIVGYGDISCPECGHDSMAVDPTADRAELVCPECGTEWD